MITVLTFLLLLYLAAEVKELAELVSAFQTNI